MRCASLLLLPLPAALLFPSPSKVYYARPYTFIGLGVFCLMANMLAMIHLAYYMREYQHTEFEEYVHVRCEHWARTRAHARSTGLTLLRPGAEENETTARSLMVALALRARLLRLCVCVHLCVSQVRGRDDLGGEPSGAAGG